MFSKRGYFWVFTLLILFFASCSKYNKILKSSDFELKYSKAIEYYEKKDYNRALPLLEELIPIFKVDQRGEKVYYYYCWCNYLMGDYILAGYHFNNFAKTFPNSKHAEECKYMNAYCYYLDSPDYSLDQTNTYKAIDQMQLFINRYPESDSIARCNTLIDEMRGKLEKKAFETAKLYYKLGDYKGAITALNNTIKDYPDSDYRQEMAFLAIRSNYLLAVNSIESKKKERFQETIDAYLSFLDIYPESEFLKDAENIYTNAVRELKKLNNS